MSNVKFPNSKKPHFCWTEILVRRLCEASVLYPKENFFRMKRIANYVGEDVTDHQCQDKLKYMNRKKKCSLFPTTQGENAGFVKFEPTFPSHEKYPFGPDGIPIGFKCRFNSNSRWSKDMDDKLREAEKLFPPGSSGSNKNIAKFMGGGITGVQVISRRHYLAERHLEIDRVRWTSEMDKELARAVQQCTGVKYANCVHWPGVNKIMNMHNQQSRDRWFRFVARQPRICAAGIDHGTPTTITRSGGGTVTEAEDYLSESDYWVDVSDPATAKRLNRRKRNRDLFLSMWNSGGDTDNNSVVYVVHSSDSSYCNDINDDSVCSDDLHSVSDVYCYDGSSGTGSSYPVKRQRCDDDIVLDDKNSDVDFENYVTITDELIDMLGLYDSSSGESDCD